MGAGEAVEVELALGVEANVAGAFSDLLHDGRGEDLTAPSVVGDARGQDHVPAVEVGLVLDRFARSECRSQVSAPRRCRGPSARPTASWTEQAPR
jgi:hypothetical protein